MLDINKHHIIYIYLLTSLKWFIILNIVIIKLLNYWEDFNEYMSDREPIYPGDLSEIKYSPALKGAISKIQDHRISEGMSPVDAKNMEEGCLVKLKM